MANKEYSNNTDKTEPRRNAYALSPDLKTSQTPSHELHTT